MNTMSDLNVCVLGAGVIGLTTALELQKEFPNAKITIQADKFYKDTTSFVAAGLFLPSVTFQGPTFDITREWIRSSYYHWNDLYTCYGSLQVGIKEMPGFVYSNKSAEDVKNRYVDNLLPIHRKATEEELNTSPVPWKYGSFMTTMVIENDIYLPWATNKFLNNNGKILKNQTESFSEFAGKYDVVLNCTGLGSRVLCQDYKIAAIRGQILKVQAPWIDKFYFAEHDTYIIPGFEGLTLGGTRQFESYSLDWNKYIELDILERCSKVLPSIKHCPIIAKRVGLRPFRCPVRVESEVQNTSAGKIKIIHNYGHGGYGVTSAPGTAKYAVKLLRDMLISNSKL